MCLQWDLHVCTFEHNPNAVTQKLSIYERVELLPQLRNLKLYLCTSSLVPYQVLNIKTKFLSENTFNCKGDLQGTSWSLFFILHVSSKVFWFNYPERMGQKPPWLSTPSFLYYITKCSIATLLHWKLWLVLYLAGLCNINET